MIATPRHLMNTPVVLTSGMGFDAYGEVTYSGSAVVSGTGFLKTRDEFEVTNQGVVTVQTTELLTDPAVFPVSAKDKVDVQGGPASGTTFRVTNVRSVVDPRDGFQAVDISKLVEVEV